MRIVGGSLKGIHLTDVKKITNYTRPTSTRLRENLFNILTHNFQSLLKGHFIDCFAGTGSIGLEALSRGAQHVTFIEKQPAVLHVLKKNIDKCQASKKITIMTYARKIQADIIFFDPPYNHIYIPKNYLASLYIVQSPIFYKPPCNSIVRTYGNHNLLFWGDAVTNFCAKNNAKQSN